MTHPRHSQYIRFRNKSALIRRWITTILLRSDLKSHLMFSGLDPVITSGFDTSSFTRDNRDDESFIRPWLESELERCGNESFDESDVFAVNTRQIQKSMGLNRAELAIFRFACLLICYKPLEAASEIGACDFTEADTCDLLAELLKLPFGRVYEALRPSGLLRTSGLIRVPSGWNNTQHLTRWLMIPDMIAREVFRTQADDNQLINVFYTVGPKSDLTQHDFPQRSELALTKDYLRASFREKAEGVNVLIWGPPGTGKTQMARHIAQSLRKKALEINSIGIDGQAISASDRLDCYRFCQAILARNSNSIVVFDEVEEVICSGSFSRYGFKENGGFTKGLVNTILESNRTPAIWITNTVDGVDPAYLRRFDIVVKLDTPVSLVKKKIAARTFRDLPIEQSVVDRMVQHNRITPAHMSKVTRICQRLGVDTPEHAASIARQVLNGDLKAVQAPPLVPKKPVKKKAGKALPYRPDLINCDVDVSALANSLTADSSIRICSFGPPGTGKTAWARYLAKQVGRPLIVKHAADILDKFVGETEKNIRNAFREAESTRSVLLLDEADGFLPDRTTAERHWEITQANQFLTAMEEFEGILVCATNLMEHLDPATMRRFDVKVHFDFLTTKQSCDLAIELYDLFGIDLTNDAKRRVQETLLGTDLTFGDFAALTRRYAALKCDLDWQRIVNDLKTEASYRKPKSRPIGFLSNLGA